MRISIQYLEESEGGADEADSRTEGSDESEPDALSASDALHTWNTVLL